MSPGGVTGDNSVTLTLTDAQGMLDGVTLNLNTQVRRNALQQSTQSQEVKGVSQDSLVSFSVCDYGD